MALDTTRRNQYGRNCKSEWLRSGIALSCIIMFLRWYFHDLVGFRSFQIVVSYVCVCVCLCVCHGNVWLLNVCCVDWKLQKWVILKVIHHGNIWLLIVRRLKIVRGRPGWCVRHGCIELLSIRCADWKICRVVSAALFNLSLFWIFVESENGERRSWKNE